MPGLNLIPSEGESVDLTPIEERLTALEDGPKTLLLDANLSTEEKSAFYAANQGAVIIEHDANIVTQTKLAVPSRKNIFWGNVGALTPPLTQVDNGSRYITANSFSGRDSTWLVSGMAYHVPAGSPMIGETVTFRLWATAPVATFSIGSDNAGGNGAADGIWQVTLAEGVNQRLLDAPKPLPAHPTGAVASVDNPSGKHQTSSIGNYPVSYPANAPDGSTFGFTQEDAANVPRFYSMNATTSNGANSGFHVFGISIICERA